MNLQSSLILLGVVVILLIFVVSFWKDRFGGLFSNRSSNKRLGGGGLISSREFVLGSEEENTDRADIEPTLDRMDVELEEPAPQFEGLLLDDDDGEGPRQLSLGDALHRRAVSQEETIEQEDDFPEESYSNVRQLDYWVKVVGDDPIPRDDILAIYRQQEYMLEHPHAIHGRLASSGEWSDIETEAEDEEFLDIVLSLQLADRNSAVNESEMTRFNNLAFMLSESFDRQFKFQSSSEDALDQASRLEQFSAEFDVLAIINICAEGDRQFRGPEVLRVVEGSGMRYGDLHVFHGPDGDDGEPLFSIANMVKPGVFDLEDMQNFQTRGLTMYMNVPRCKKPGDVFARMSYVANKIATNLGGEMRDQNNNALDDKSIQQIRKQVDEIGANMSAQGMQPGSYEALRLF